MRIWFASNRDVKHETSARGKLFGERFNTDGPQCFRVGYAELTLNGDPRETDDWTLGAAQLYPEKLGRNQRGSSRFFEDLRDALKGSERDVVIYLHGFANTFENTLIRAASLQNLYGDDGRRALVIPFSWPSNGRIQPGYEYFSDREDAAASGLAMARALDALAGFLASLERKDRGELLRARRAGKVPDLAALERCGRRLHIVAHSMGAHALRSALRAFDAEHDGAPPRLIDDVFLMAADVDDDALDTGGGLDILFRTAQRVFVYHAADDIPLRISDWTKGNGDRLGLNGPAELDALPVRAMAINCDDVCATEFFDDCHQYYRARREVIADVVATLRGERQDLRSSRVNIRPGRSWRLRPSS